jgi:hypothetical protein
VLHGRNLPHLAVLWRWRAPWGPDCHAYAYASSEANQEPRALADAAKGAAERAGAAIIGALTSMVQREDKVNSQSETMQLQQSKIEQLAERVMGLETQLKMPMRAVEIKRLSQPGGTRVNLNLHLQSARLAPQRRGWR